MRKKNDIVKVSALLLILLMIIMILLTSCSNNQDDSKTQLSQLNLTNINISKNTENIIIVLNESKEIELELVEVEEQENETQEEIGEEAEERISEVEFYFLLRGKSYIKHMLGEGEEGKYNMSGEIFTITPIIITREEVKFRINNFTTKTLGEDGTDGTQEYEIIVKDIYYRL